MDYNKLSNEDLDTAIRLRHREAEKSGDTERQDYFKRLVLTCPEPYTPDIRSKVIEALQEDDKKTLAPKLRADEVAAPIAIPFSEALTAFKVDEASYRDKLFIPSTPSDTVKYLTELDLGLEGREIAYEPHVRVHRFLLNQHLTQLGVAPRWRGLVHEAFLPGTQWGKNMKFDNFLYDLEWLSARRKFDWLPVSERKKPHVKNIRWKKLFEDGFSLNLAESIITNTKKRNVKLRELNLDDQLLWECWTLRTKEFKKIIDRHKRREQKALDAISEAAEYIPQITQEHISSRLQYWRALTLSEWRPTAAARQYRMITGKTITQQSMSEMMKKLYETPGLKTYV